EDRILRGGDRDLLAGARVAAGAGGALLDLEGTEADQGHGVALLQGLAHRRQHGVDGARGIGLGQVGLVGDGVDQIVLVHVFGAPARPAGRSNWWRASVRHTAAAPGSPAATGPRCEREFIPAPLTPRNTES